MDVQNLNLQEEGKRKQNKQHYIHCVVLGFFFPAGGTTDGKSLVKVPKKKASISAIEVGARPDSLHRGLTGGPVATDAMAAFFFLIHTQ